MTAFVLVHGAWHGGWCYRETAAELRKEGHEVFTPTHTGVGEKAHLASEAITLETHVRDVLGCIEKEELDDIVLCGHSYGGMVITQVADRVPGKIRALVYLDAFVPEHGDSLIGLLGKALEPDIAKEFVGGFRATAAEGASGMMLPIPAEVFGILPENCERVDRLCVPQALATFEMPVLLTGDASGIARRVYILADDWDPSPFRHFAKKLDGTRGWEVVTIASSHDVMVDHPEELAAELLKLA